MPFLGLGSAPGSPADNSVTSQKIYDGAVTAADLHTTAVTDKLGFTPVTNARTLTINGTSYDLTANRTWTIDALPSQSTHNGKYLTTDGTTASWSAVSVTPTAVSDQANSSTGYFDLPSGTTAERPGSPSTGMIRFNTSLNAIEAYATSKWEIVSYFTTPGTPTIGTATVTGSTTATVSYTVSTYPASPLATSYTAVSSPGGITGTLSTAGSGTITVSGLTPNTSYTFTVYGTNNVGNSASSAASNSITTNQAMYSATYLIVAGGGAGNQGYINDVNTAGGGGGAGGYLTGTVTLTGGTVYTATVGGGGTFIPNYSNTSPSGSNSSLTSVGTTAIGGGGGGMQSRQGGNGGSGGGGASGSGNSNGGSGTAGQGNNGANGGGPGANGGGGGGAGGAGGNPSGGSGTANSITGSSVTYAAGGTGSSWGGGSGSNGTANTGNGGGGSWNQSTAGNGGSGVVILSVPTASYSGTTTGSPTVTTSGSNTIIRFTASGSYTA